MAPVTRGAARRLADACDGDSHNNTNQLASLRQQLPAKKVVWESRNNLDAYTHQSIDQVVSPQTDHVIEIQFLEHSFVDGIIGSPSNYSAIERETAAKHLRDQFNSTTNLNVTSMRVNLAKRGPHVAALNRLRNGSSLRDISLEQLARQGRAKFLVESGIWKRVEDEIVRSYDSSISITQTTERMVTRRESRLIDESQECLHQLLERVGIF
jgi:hypothetical protein